MYFLLCPYCGNKTPVNNFCSFCGKFLTEVTICQHCFISIPTSASYCPNCRYSLSPSKVNDTIKISTYSSQFFSYFRVSILIIFLLSTYFLTQLVIGSVLLIISEDFINNNPLFFSLLLTLFSSAFMIIIITKFIPFSFHRSSIIENQTSISFLLIILFIVSASIVEISVTLIAFGLDIIKLDPSLSSPYDEFFINPTNIFIFTLLATTIGPIFEEIVFRQFAVSAMLKQTQSKILVVCTSALIFSLAHTTSDILEGLRYAILHIIATFILGIILAIIYIRWGLKFAIIFHSFWNLYSVIIQLLIIYELSEFVDLLILLFIVITILIITFFLIMHKAFFRKILTEISFPTKNELRLFFANFFLITTHTFFLPLMLLTVEQSIITAGIIFFYQFCGFLIGLKLMKSEKTLFKTFNPNLKGLNTIQDD